MDPGTTGRICGYCLQTCAKARREAPLSYKDRHRRKAGKSFQAENLKIDGFLNLSKLAQRFSNKNFGEVPGSQSSSI